MDNITIKDLSIALIEPSVMQSRIIISHLNALDISKIQCYLNGEKALDNIRRFPVDLVMSAMYLPDMTGTDVVLALREDMQLEETAFMLISSETSRIALEPVRQAGVVAILPKPFDVAALRKVLYATVDFINPDEITLRDVDLDELNVLVVDDSLTARQHICRVLSNLGIQHIDQFAKPHDAIESLGENYYDLVVTDYNMPEMDGKELIQYIRNQSTQQSIPILMVTSEADESRLSAIQQAGVSGICDKPFDPSVINSLIRNLITME